MTIEQLESTSTKHHSVSYSETSSYLLCKRKWEYGYGRSLKRITESKSLMLGSAGHKVLQAFYESILSEGYDRKKQGSKAAWDRALGAATAAYDAIMAEGFEDADNKASLKEIVFDFYLNRDLKLEPFVLNGWLIEAVEYEAVLDTETPEGIVRTPVVIDLIAMDTDGKRVVIDHKFLNDFYDGDAAALQPQIPLYIAVLRGLNFKVAYGYYNMLRNRKIAGTKLNKAELVAVVSKTITEGGGFPDSDYDNPVSKMLVPELEETARALGIKTQTGATPEQRWQGLELKPNNARVSRQFVDQISASQEIIEFEDLPEEQRDLKAHRVANKMVCQSCSFKDLCTMELAGGNVPLLLRSEFTIRERKSFDTETVEQEEVA